jgi:hypothetical protein
MIGAVIGLVGAGLSAAQAVQQNKLQKAADKAAKEAAARLRSYKEMNALKGLQVPQMGTKLAMENIQQQTTDQLNALQGVGAEGVIAGVTGLSKNARDAQLDVAANLDEAQYRRDQAVAAEQSRINKDELARNSGIDLMELQGAQQAVADARANKAAAIQGAFGALSGGITSLAGIDKFDYKFSEGLTPEEKSVYDGLSYIDKLKYQRATKKGEKYTPTTN